MNDTCRASICLLLLILCTAASFPSVASFSLLVSKSVQAEPEEGAVTLSQQLPSRHSPFTIHRSRLGNHDQSIPFGAPSFHFAFTVYIPFCLLLFVSVYFLPVPSPPLLLLLLLLSPTLTFFLFPTTTHLTFIYLTCFLISFLSFPSSSHCSDLQRTEKHPQSCSAATVLDTW